MRNAYRILAEKPEGMRPLTKPRRRWQDSVKTGGEVVGWIHVAENRVQWRVLVDTLIDYRVP